MSFFLRDPGRLRLHSVGLAAAVSILVTGELHAQQMRGTVTDSASGHAVSGVVIMLLDSAGNAIARNLSDQQGAFVFPAFPAARKVRAQRIGYRPRELAFPAPDAVEVSLAIIMAPLPRMLDPVRSVVSARCKGGKRVVEAYGLLEQARDALLATIVAAETRPASMVLIGYRRSYRSTSEDDGDLTSQEVHIDSISARPRTYVAAKTPAEFMRSGFTGDVAFTASGRLNSELLAPDAETLISPEFADTYCFEIGDDDRRRPGQVSLRFRRPDESRRMDVDGVIWIDTAARVLKDVEYEYVREAYGRPRSSGRIHFRGFPNGVVLIDSWQISEMRPVVALVRQPTAGTRAVSVRSARSTLHTSGGILAYASWPDGVTHSTALGAARLEVKRDDGRTPAEGVVVHFVGSPYFTLTDAAGIAHFTGVMPATYQLVAFDTVLAPYKIGTDPLGTVRVDTGGIVTKSVKTITAVDYVTQRCKRAKRFGGDTYLLGRVVDARNTALRDAEVSVSRRGSDGNWVVVGQAQKTGADGFWFLCDAAIAPGSEIRAAVARFDQTAAVESRTLGKVTIVDLRVP